MKNSKTTTGNKRKWLAVGGLGIVSALVCLGILSSTLARYTYTETLTDTARVAVFDVSVGNGDKTFNLFDTILDSDGVSNETDVAKAGAGETAIIAPGTSGNFELVLHNDSEVNVDYAIEISVGATTIPLQFSTDGSTWSNDFSSALANGAIAMGTSENLTMYWQWAFDGDDVLDTSLGEQAQIDPETVTATASVTFVQAD